MKMLTVSLLLLVFTGIYAHASCEVQAAKMASSLNRSLHNGDPEGTAGDPKTLSSKSLNLKSMRDGGSLETVRIVYSYPTWSEIYTLVFVEDYAQGDCHINSYAMTIEETRP